MFSQHLPLTFVATLGLAACAAEGRTDGVPQPGNGSEAPDGDGGPGGDDDGPGGDDGGTAGDDGGILYDVASGEGDGGDGPSGEGCEKVDFLFVIDSSSSMNDDQENLVANIPGFISGMQSLLPKVDSYHVGVITTDSYIPNVPNCQRIGSLVMRKFWGDRETEIPCGPYAEGHNFMTDADDLAATFPCPAQMEGGSGTEKPMLSLMAAVDGRGLDGPGECNEGLLRDDSLLIVVILTDEPDGTIADNPWKTPGWAPDWFDAVVEDRGGIEGNIAVLSLITTPDRPCDDDVDPADIPLPPEQTGDEIRKFTEMFTHGFAGAICAPDYGPYFQQALSVVESACSGFVPPG